MIRQGKEIRATREHYRRCIAVYLLDYDAHGRRMLAAAPTFALEPEGFADVEPTLRLSDEGAQRLIDDLWEAGFRPVAGQQSEGVTAAQARHLEDMRQLTFARLGVEKP